MVPILQAVNRVHLRMPSELEFSAPGGKYAANGKTTELTVFVLYPRPDEAIAGLITGNRQASHCNLHSSVSIGPAKLAEILIRDSPVVWVNRPPDTHISQGYP